MVYKQFVKAGETDSEMFLASKVSKYSQNNINNVLSSMCVWSMIDLLYHSKVWRKGKMWYPKYSHEIM